MIVEQISDYVNLLKTDSEKLISQIKDGKVTLPISKNYKPVVDEIQISISGNHISYGTILEEKPDWSEFINKILNDRLIKNGAIGSLAPILVKETSLPKKHDNAIGQMEFWLGNFFRTVIKEECDFRYNGKKPKSTSNYVYNLMMELNEVPLISEFELKLSGVFISSNDAILQYFSIRKIQPKDIDAEQSFSTMHRNIPDCVVTFQIKETEESGGWKRATNALDIFRLFKLSSVSYLSFRKLTQSIIWSHSGGVSFSLDNPFSKYKYEISDRDIPDFHKFSESFFPVLELQNDSEKDMFAFKIALERYRNSTLDRVEDGRNLLTAVIGLEALYTSKHELGEIKYRLSIRIAKLLSYFGFDSRNTRKIVEDAYGYRNTIGHGSNIDPKDFQKVKENLEKILEILRISVIVFGIVMTKMNKNHILFGLDDLMLGMDNQELETEIKKIQSIMPEIVLKMSH